METDWQPTREPQIDYGTEVSIGSQKVLLSRQEVDPKDVPNPIVYDDEFGKTVLTFSKIGMRDGVKMYDITYKHNKSHPYSLSKLKERLRLFVVILLEAILPFLILKVFLNLFFLYKVRRKLNMLIF